MRLSMLLTLLALLAVVALPARAVDGVVEINQTCAITTGCGSGDSPGYPVTLDGSNGRSFRLTGDLVVPNVDTHGILVSVDDVTVDLNGFSIIGAACVGSSSSSCTASGSGSGVRVDNFNTRLGIAVRNGSILGMGEAGVLLGSQSQVSRLRSRWNGQYGIYVFPGSTVTNSTVYENGTGSGDIALFANRGSTVTGNAVYDNTGDGIVSQTGALITGNTVYSNGRDGIRVNNGSTVVGNSVYQNTDNGIETILACLVAGNTVESGGSSGLNLSADTLYRDNVIRGALIAPVVGGVNGGGNLCPGFGAASPTCP